MHKNRPYMEQKFVQYAERGNTARSDCLGTRYNRDRAAHKLVIRVGACADFRIGKNKIKRKGLFAFSPKFYFAFYKPVD